MSRYMTIACPDDSLLYIFMHVVITTSVWYAKATNALDAGAVIG